MKRRDFLTGLLLMLSSRSWATQKTSFVADSLLLPTKSKEGLAKLRLQNFEELLWVDLPYRPHALARLSKNNVLVLPKEAQSYARILSSDKLVTIGELQASKGASFFGHGSVSPDGKKLALIEAFLDKGFAQVVIYDRIHEMRRLKTISIKEIVPHDVIWRDEDNLVLNQRTDAYGGLSLKEGHAYLLNLQNGRLVQWLKSKPGMFIGHFYQHEEELFAVSVAKNEQKAENCFGRVKSSSLKFYDMKPTQMKPFKPGALHVSFSSDGAGVTFPWEGAVRHFNIKKDTFEFEANLSPEDAPLAIEYDSPTNSYFVFSTSGKVFQWKPEKSQLTEVYKLSEGSAESHVYRWKQI